MAILIVFAVFRLSRMIAQEEGPFSMFEWIRMHVDKQQQTWVGRGLNCPMCISFWLSLVFVPLLPEYNPFVAWLGIAGAVAALLKLLGTR